MGVEIERKFLVKDDGWMLHHPRGCTFRQGYLASGGGKGASVRVRIEGFERAYITIKGPAVEATRDEFEYDIPCFGEAETLLDRLCSAKIEKTRYKVTINGMMWEVDVFHGANSPLIVAEVELEYENQNIFVPPWVGLEVTEDPRYTNEHLAQFPYSTWGK